MPLIYIKETEASIWPSYSISTGKIHPKIFNIEQPLILNKGINKFLNSVFFVWIWICVHFGSSLYSTTYKQGFGLTVF